MFELIALGEPPSEREVECVEKAVGRLPPRYRDFIMRSNGVKPSSSVAFQLTDECESVRLGFLYGISSEMPRIDLLARYELAKDDLPKEFLPIGEDPGGNLLLVRIKGKDRDTIYFLDCRGILVKRYGKNMFRVASSIDDFLASLKQ